MKKKKIVHVVDYLMPEMGYQEFLLPKWNAKLGHDVYIVTSDRYYPVPNYSDTWEKLLGKRICGIGERVFKGVKIIRLPVQFEVKARPWIKGLIKTIKDIEPDLVLVHGTGSFSIYKCAILLNGLDFPVFADNHMIKDVVQKGFFQNIYYLFHKFMMQNFLSRKIDIFFGVTKDSCDYLQDFEGVPTEKIELLPLGVDTGIFKPQEDDKESSKIPVIVQSGKLNQDKKPQWLAEAVLNILKDGLKVKLKFVGSGSTIIISEIKNSFRNAGYEEYLEFIDMLSLKELAKEFNSANIVVFPEATSLSAIEAASCDTAVVMTDLPAAQERVKNGVGLSYKRGDIENLSSVLMELINDPIRLHSLAISSGKNARSVYSYETISQQLLDYLDNYKSLEI